MTKDQIKALSKIKTIDEEYEEVRKYYQDNFNALPYEERRLGTYGDCICAIREASIYLNQYGELIPPKLQRVIKERIKSQKKLMVDWYRADNYKTE